MNRQYLKKGEKIRLSCDESDNSFTRTFTINKKIASGASVVCYEAFYKDSVIGVLKEFYPAKIYDLKRIKKNNQLLSPS